MPKTAPRISDKSAEFIPTQFPSLNAGLEYIADSWPALHRKALAETMGEFNKKELALVIDVFNSCALTPGLAGQHLAPAVADGISFEGLDKKWGVDRAKILRKIAGLTSFQAAAIEIWAAAFWVGAGGRRKESIDEYVGNIAL